MAELWNIRGLITIRLIALTFAFSAFLYFTTIIDPRKLAKHIIVLISRVHASFGFAHDRKALRYFFGSFNLVVAFFLWNRKYRKDGGGMSFFLNFITLFATFAAEPDYDMKSAVIGFVVWQVVLSYSLTSKSGGVPVESIFNLADGHGRGT